MAEHNLTGSWGERMAAEYLERKGYRILWRDWRDGHRDIDLVAIDADELVFVEVKTRRNADFMEPEQAVDARKMRNLGYAAMAFMRRYDHEMPARFDVIGITGTEKTGYTVNHIEDAFRPF